MPGSLHSMLERWIAPLRRQVRQMVMQAIVDTVDDAGAVQLLSIAVGSDETLHKVQRIQPHGLATCPSDGAEALVVLVGGSRELPVAVCVGGAAVRPTGLQPGEVVLYKDTANYIKLDKDGNITIVCEGKVSIQATGNIEVGGTALKALATEDFVNSVYKMHMHPTAAPGVPSVPTPIPMPTELTTKTKAE